MSGSLTVLGLDYLVFAIAPNLVFTEMYVWLNINDRIKNLNLSVSVTQPMSINAGANHQRSFASFAWTISLCVLQSKFLYATASFISVRYVSIMSFYRGIQTP